MTSVALSVSTNRASGRVPWLEGHGEAVEQIGKEEQDREVDPLHDLPGQVLRIHRQDAAGHDHPRQRHERERCPEGRDRALAAPLAHADDRDRREQYEVDDPDDSTACRMFASSWAGKILSLVEKEFK